MEPLDAVVLAGGRSERLAGIVPPHHKPFLVIGGESLVLAAIRHAHTQRAIRIVVVTCAEIALPLAGLVATLPPRIRGSVVITLSNTGVGPALAAGAALCESERLLVLMADNLTSSDDVALVCREEYAVGVRLMPTLDAYRFTRWVRGRWVEDGVTAADTDLTQVWCGPLVLNRECVLRYGDANPGGKIGPHLDRLAPSPQDLVRVSVETTDVGTPDELRKLTGGLR